MKKLFILMCLALLTVQGVSAQGFLNGLLRGLAEGAQSASNMIMQNMMSGQNNAANLQNQQGALNRQNQSTVNVSPGETCIVENGRKYYMDLNGGWYYVNERGTKIYGMPESLRNNKTYIIEDGLKYYMDENGGWYYVNEHGTKIYGMPKSVSNNATYVDPSLQTSESYYNSSTSTNSSTNSNSQSSTPKTVMCNFCKGTGDRVVTSSVGTYGLNTTQKRCSRCGETYMSGTTHTHTRCSYCSGTGQRRL